MSRHKSIFGAYADKLQAVVDQSKDRFAPTWYQKYFNFGTSQTSLTYTSVLGASRIEAAASIISRNSSAPLRSRAALAKLSGEIPAISEKFKMSEQDYRDFYMLQQLNVDDQAKKNQLMDLLFNDTKKAGESAHKRLDYLCLEAVSTGQITITVDNNPDGFVNSVALDLGMPSANKKNAAVSWATSATATPITDINNVVEAAFSEGRSFSKILMSRNAWLKFSKAKEVIDSLTAYFSIAKGQLTVVTLDKVNNYLEDNLLPVIEIVNEVVGIEKDGVISAQRPFNDNNVSFIPAGPLGRIHHAYAIEDLQKVAGVSYASYNKALISKWQENDPFAEYTKVELNAFPGFEAIEGTYLLSTVAGF
ncbi:major capsid protein [Pontibacter sp. BT731]|uniref:major capsid protein n=1 Tax=Pontibacter coccineus TaxID=3063328 RepID=UPI0026E1E147|nr:major capsid protein [Pontibacter sp. BT731]MDO6389003.1 major capsid protein [Pontibacter sp. BT731]